MKTYKKTDLVKIAKRDNNNKRPYLLVDPLQGKHLPVSPKKTIELFDELGKKLYETYPDENLLIIGFAETATAIGASLAFASKDPSYYIHTTRECVKNSDFLYFSESHSHATEQRISTNNLLEMITSTDRIVFVEDEVTTGNTILNIVNILKKEFSSLNLKFGVISILNCIPKESVAMFDSLDISFIYILKLENEDYTKQLESYTFDNENIHVTTNAKTDVRNSTAIIMDADPRVGLLAKKYKKQCELFTSSILASLDKSTLSKKNILVLGTEEFMFPALHFANAVEESQDCHSVSFHATTRSPILPSIDKNYPIFCRYELNSLYDHTRTTFVYNLKKYDSVFILHDSNASSALGIQSLIQALKDNDCNNISIYRWSD